MLAIGLDNQEGREMQAEQEVLDRRVRFDEVDVTKSAQVMSAVRLAEREVRPSGCRRE